MNKTVSINLGGFFFHIDEDAYQKLNRYFDAIKRSLSTDSREEIMNDIESRIAELLSEKLKNDKQVVSNREIEEIISIMGQPEDYKIDGDDANEKEPKTTFFSNSVKSKKFYRDKNKGIIGGVSAGLGHYFRIDPLWIRILFIISPFISFGTSLIIYVLLWILIPEAVTTTEKLEMKGEPINISNIEKKVKEGIDTISEKIQNVDYDKIGISAKTGIQKAGNTIGDIFMAIFKGIAKLLGALILIFAGLTLGSLIVGFFMLLFSSTLPDISWYPYINNVNYTEIPTWLLGLFAFFAIGIPFFFLFLLGLKILVNNLKSIGSITKYTLLAVWLITVAIMIYFGIRQATEVGFEGKTVNKELINISERDTLSIKFRYNDYFSKNIDRKKYRFTQDSIGNNIIYNNKIELNFIKTDRTKPYLQIEKIAEGNSVLDAKNRAENIQYGYEIDGNKLILDNYLITDIANKYRNQQIRAFIYLPEGFIIKPDQSINNYHEARYSNLYIPYANANNIYQAIGDELKCIDCMEEKDYNKHTITDEHNVTNGTITINDKGINIKVRKDSIYIKSNDNK